MTRTTILALIAAVSAGSTAYAVEGLDGDNNPVPSAADQVYNSGVYNSGLALERSYGAVHHQAAPIRRHHVHHAE